MRKLLILVVVLAIAGYAGYGYLQQNPVMKAKVEEKKFQANTAVLATKVVQAQTPGEVKELLAENRPTLEELKQKGYLTEEDIAFFTKTLDQMEARGEPFNRVKFLEVYAKDKLTPEKYRQVEEILRKPDLGTADIYQIVTIIKGP